MIRKQLNDGVNKTKCRVNVNETTIKEEINNSTYRELIAMSVV